MNEANRSVGDYACQTSAVVLLLVAFFSAVIALSLGPATAFASTPENEGAAPAVATEAVSVQEAAANDAASEAPQEEVVEDHENPLALIPTPGYWSLVDVLAASGAALIAMGLAVNIIRRRDDDAVEDEQDTRRTRFLVPASLAVATVSLLGVLITQDFTEQLALFDTWTPLFTTCLVANVAFVLVDRRCNASNDDQGGSAPAHAAV